MLKCNIFPFQEYIISKVCIDSAVAARSVVKSYYDSYLEREYTELNKDDQDELYSSFCRRVTPGQDEVAFSIILFNFIRLISE